MSKFRTITLKYSTKCRRCERPIGAGERARWAKGAGVWHRKEDCPDLVDVGIHGFEPVNGPVPFVGDPIDLAWEDDCAERAGVGSLERAELFDREALELF